MRYLITLLCLIAIGASAQKNGMLQVPGRGGGLDGTTASNSFVLRQSGGANNLQSTSTTLRATIGLTRIFQAVGTNGTTNFFVSELASTNMSLRLGGNVSSALVLSNNYGNSNSSIGIAGAAPSIYLRENGNVGIGTNAPGAGLDVQGTVQLNGVLSSTKAIGNTAGGANVFFNDVQTSAGSMQVSAAGQFIVSGRSKLSSSANGFVELTTQDASALSNVKGSNFQGNSLDITNQALFRNGNVGIGTTTPQAKLDVSNAVGSATGPIFHAGTNTSNGLTVDTNGNVGIGTTTPSAKLHVVGDGLITGGLTLSGAGQTWGAVNNAQLIKADNANAQLAMFLAGLNGAFRVEYNNTNLFYVGGNGLVGIGTTTPTQPLVVQMLNGTADPVLWRNTTLAMGYLTYNATTNAGAVVLQSNATTKVILDAGGNSYFNGGNIGIGTTTPIEKLHTVGNTWTTNGAIMQAFSVTAPAAPAHQGAAYWNDGTNVCVVLRNSAGALSTNKLSMTAWP